VAKVIDLNADIGEGFNSDLELMEIVSSVNICLGLHAGSPALTERTIEFARLKDLNVGMHPGFPDRKSFGRALPESSIEKCAWIESLLDQIEATHVFDYIKPHGAFFHAIARCDSEFEPIWNRICEKNIGFLGLSKTEHQWKCNQYGIHFVSEGYCERRYDSFGELVPRSESHAELTELDEICDQALWLAQEVDSICIHGDRPDCVRIATAVRETLESNGFSVRRFSLQ
jgi:5-oxoprolinase (ATP-hydrolysing) subunit A